jgi:hypothetical protein
LKGKIEHVLWEAEQYKVRNYFQLPFKHSADDIVLYLAEDEGAAARIQSKNSLESYAYNLRNSLTDKKTTDKFEAGDKSKLETASTRPSNGSTARRRR